MIKNDKNFETNYMKKYFLGKGNVLALSIFMLTVLVLMSSCEKDPPTAKLIFEHQINGEAISFDTDYQLGNNNTTVNLDIAQFYVSNLRLIKDDNTELNYDDYYLITSTDNQIDLGEIDEGEYKQISFDIGIDSVTNYLDPLTYAAGDPLAGQSPSMHWAWATGYKFLRVDGTYDSDGDGTIAANDSTLVLHIGSDAYLKTVSVVYALDAAGDENYDLNIKVDYAGLFDYNINEFPETRTGVVNDRHTNIANSIPVIFSR